MSRFYCALVLAAVFCSVAGHPVEDNVSGDVAGSAMQYRQLVESYGNFAALKKIVENYEAEKVKFYLYTKQQPHKVEIKHEDFLYSLKNSTFNVVRPTKIFIHDHLFPEYYYKELVTAYLRHYSKSVNVITVDYSHYSGVEPIMYKQFYTEIYATVAKFFEVLCQYPGVVGDKIHIIGHGTGAHIAAAAAQKVTSVKVDRITGLDPTSLEFDQNKNLPQLQKHAASFVDVIVTNAGGVGTKEKSRGHVNFFPNGGYSQPQNDDMMISHLKSYFYFVESIVRGKVFEACVVDGYENYKTVPCRHSTEMNYMGEYVLRNKVGNFYLNVNPVPPYSVSKGTSLEVEEVKLSETYLCVVLGTKLEPFTFISKDDPDYKNAVACSNQLFKGFVEDRHNSHVHGHGGKMSHKMVHNYSDDLKTQ